MRTERILHTSSFFELPCAWSGVLDFATNLCYLVYCLSPFSIFLLFDGIMFLLLSRLFSFYFPEKKKNCLLLSIQLSIWFWRKKIFPSFKNIFPSTIKRNTCLLLGRFYMDFLFHKAEESSFNLLSYIKLASIPASMSIIPFLEIRDCLSQKYNFYDYERLPFFFLPFSFFLNFFFFLFILLMWPFFFRNSNIGKNSG